MSHLEDLLQHWEQAAWDDWAAMSPKQAARLVRRALWDDNAVSGEEHATTQKMPPVRDTVLRRPPTNVRELRGPELLHALAEELQRYEQESDES